MATCVPNTLIEQNPCYFTLPSQVQAAIGLQLWCDISANITPITPVIPPNAWFNPDVNAPIAEGGSGDIIVNPTP